MFYIRVALTVLWVLACSCLWTILNLFQLGSINRFSRSVRFASAGVLWILGIRVKLEEGHHFHQNRPILILCNHQSMLDTFLFGSICPPGVTVIAKKELRLLPIIGWWLASMGVIFIDRKNKDKARETIDISAKAIKERGASIAILPEGTRNLSGRGLLPFKKGAFHLAISTHVPIVPAVCSPLAEVANYKNRVLNKKTVTIRVLPPIPTESYQEADLETLLTLTRTKMEATLRDLEQSTT